MKVSWIYGKFPLGFLAKSHSRLLKLQRILKHLKLMTMSGIYRKSENWAGRNIIKMVGMKVGW